jgi:hypothetical protein
VSVCEMWHTCPRARVTVMTVANKRRAARTDVKTADLRYRYYGSQFRMVHRPGFRRIFAQ